MLLTSANNVSDSWVRLDWTRTWSLNMNTIETTAIMIFTKHRILRLDSLKLPWPIVQKHEKSAREAPWNGPGHGWTPLQHRRLRCLNLETEQNSIRSCCGYIQAFSNATITFWCSRRTQLYQKVQLDRTTIIACVAPSSLMGFRQLGLVFHL